MNNLHNYGSLSPALTHVSDSVDENNDPLDSRPPAPSAQSTLEAILDHFRHYRSLDELELLRNPEYCTTIRDLIWINRIETTELRRNVQDLEDQLEHMQAHSERRLQRMEDQLSRMEKNIMFIGQGVSELKESMIRAVIHRSVLRPLVLKHILPAHIYIMIVIAIPRPFDVLMLLRGIASTVLLPASRGLN
ncbi:hypothetical protein Hypma_011472 [Hypsizygus marmoreus]|uniref:Uncharacterized protein n=1 Tax=Hypsizygus marmoreus TaxID=39966 RepID=A0A151VH40_HYPMA|nr:hypothetical protein Hypma_001732 [Hypsizygus marmoreus]RDB21282.1 hypothetical protein Hypma_011472 [Hypsizygus marmoreus]